LDLQSHRIPLGIHSYGRYFLFDTPTFYSIGFLVCSLRISRSTRDRPAFKVVDHPLICTAFQGAEEEWKDDSFAFMELKFPDGSAGSRLGGCNNTTICHLHERRRELRCEQNICFQAQTRLSLFTRDSAFAIAMVDGSSRCRPVPY
jgi:hypothetical protein